MRIVALASGGHHIEEQSFSIALQALGTDTVDVSESGPLGPLWPDGLPPWEKTKEATPQIAVNFDSNFTEEGIEACLSYVAELYRLEGGAGLKVVEGLSFTPEDAEVTQ